MPEALKGKSIVLVDDSIVRGTTSRKLVRMLRRGWRFKAIHMRISSPPIIGSCYYGIDTPTKKELIASSHSVDEIARYITADSLGYLSLEGMYQALGEDRSRFCDACFSGDYLVEFPRNRAQMPLRLVGA